MLGITINMVCRWVFALAFMVLGIWLIEPKAQYVHLFIGIVCLNLGLSLFKGTNRY